MSLKCKKIEPNTEIDQLLYKYFTGEHRKGYVEVGDEKIVMPVHWEDIADEIENFEVRDTDIWVVSYPKTGTTWTQEMVWLIQNNLDFEGALKENLMERYTFVEFQSLFDFENVKKKFPNYDSIDFPTNTVEIARNDKRVPRFIKSHLPWCLLPKALREGTTKAKLIYVMRNPKDTCVSFYHHKRLTDGYRGSFEEFCEIFLAGKIYYGSYWTMLDYWKRKNEPNILLIKFEDMKRDISSVIRIASDFLIGRQYSDEQISQLAEHLSFENIRSNPSVNYEAGVKAFQLFVKNADKNEKFMRAGIVGSYKAEMTPEMEKRFDEWTKEHLKGLDITF